MPITITRVDRVGSRAMALRGTNSDTNQTEYRENYDQFRVPITPVNITNWPPLVGDVLSEWPSLQNKPSTTLPPDTSFPGIGIGVSNGAGITQVASIGQFLATPNKRAGDSAFMRAIADGVPGNVPTFTGYKILLSNWNNGAGIPNLLEFFFDGVDHYLSVNAAIGAIAVDTTAPARVGVPTLNTARTQITIAYNEPIAGTVVPANYTLTGATITSLSIVGQSVAIVVPAITAGAAVTLAYTGQTVVDGAGNPAPTFAAITLDTATATPFFNTRVSTLTEADGVYTGTAGGAWSNVGSTDTANFTGVKTLKARVPSGNGNAMMLGLDAAAGTADYNSWDYGLFLQGGVNYRYVVNGALTALTPAVIPVANAQVRMIRNAANNLKAEYSHDDGATWTLIFDFGLVTASLYCKVASNTAAVDQVSLV
jgi:hypothetical protein